MAFCWKLYSLWETVMVYKSFPHTRLCFTRSFVEFLNSECPGHNWNGLWHYRKQI